jgi:hypothetical protein
MIAKSIF